jgi:hypothetical protein
VIGSQESLSQNSRRTHGKTQHDREKGGSTQKAQGSRQEGSDNSKIERGKQENGKDKKADNGAAEASAYSQA